MSDFITNSPLLIPAIIVAYLTIFAVIAGVWREQDGDFKDAGAALLWPILAPVAALWCLTWLGRGPYKLVKSLKRPKIPKAKVV